MCTLQTCPEALSVQSLDLMLQAKHFLKIAFKEIKKKVEVLMLADIIPSRKKSHNIDKLCITP